MSARESVLELKARIGGDIIGQEQIVERLLIGLLANGNLLVEGLPGLAKTRAVKSLRRHRPRPLRPRPRLAVRPGSHHARRRARSRVRVVLHRQVEWFRP